MCALTMFVAQAVQTANAARKSNAFKLTVIEMRAIVLFYKYLK